MSSNRDNFIQGYFDQNAALVKSLVIKFDYAASLINRQITLDNGPGLVDENDPTTWKYYMNLAGEYHSLDKPMIVTSLDTRKEILFSVDELRRHTATAEAYQMGSRYYLALLREFPEQEALINGVLYPADKAKAIAAENGSILAYRTSLVEENETTLIIELENYVKRMLARWLVGAYSLTDEYYPAMFFIALAGMMELEILRLRNDRRKTAEVHSFHIREYLASHNGLDRYLGFLTRDQALYLYRNIKYIRRNSGNNFMFDELNKKILEVRDIPLDDYSIRQLSEETKEGYPVIQARRVGLNKNSASSQDPYVSIDEFFNKERQTTVGNERFYQLSKKEMVHSLSTSNSSVIQTKDTESSMVDLTGALPDSLTDVMMRQWLYMTFNGLYDVVVNFTDPITTEERSLMSRDAIKYVAWLTYRSEGMRFIKLPPVMVSKYRVHPRPPVEQLLDLIPDDFRYNHLRELAHDLVGAQPNLVECFSVKMFYDLNYKVYEECMRHFFLQANEGHKDRRSVLELMCSHLFGNAPLDFSDDEPIEDWRIRNNLPVYDYSKEQALSIASTVFQSATGYLVDETKQLRYIQKALVDLFTELSSYSFQVIREINDGAIIMAGSPAERVSVESTSEAHSLDIDDGERILGLVASGSDANSVLDIGDSDYITLTPDNRTSTVFNVSDAETISISDHSVMSSTNEVAERIETYTRSFNPLNGLWVNDDPSQLLVLNLNSEQALSYAKFLGAPSK